MIMNQTQPRLLSQPHHEGKHTRSSQIALRSFGANRKIYNVIVTPSSVSLAIRQSPDKTGYLTQQRKTSEIQGLACMPITR